MLLTGASCLYHVYAILTERVFSDSLTITKKLRSNKGTREDEKPWQQNYQDSKFLQKQPMGQKGKEHAQKPLFAGKQSNV